MTVGIRKTIESAKGKAKGKGIYEQMLDAAKG